MNSYQKAMFQAYSFPIILFYLVPMGILSFSVWPVGFLELASNLLCLPITVFTFGFVISPIVGPKVRQNKLWSFVMALFCMLCGVISCLLTLTSFNLAAVFSIFTVYLLLFGLVPALIGGLFFVGASENASNIA